MKPEQQTDEQSEYICKRKARNPKMEKNNKFLPLTISKLQPGIYVSRKDPVGGSMITTFDIRMTSPNEEPVMNTVFF